MDNFGIQLKDCPALTIYGAASLKKSNTLSCFIPVGHKIKRDLSNNFAIVLWFAFSKTSLFSKNTFPGVSTSKVPTI